jgi:hypothetical protein
MLIKRPPGSHSITLGDIRAERALIMLLRLSMFSAKVPFPGAIHELPLLCSIEQPIHPEVLQEGNEFRGADGVFPHPEEVSIAGAIGTSETGDFPVGDFL